MSKKKRSVRLSKIELLAIVGLAVLLGIVWARAIEVLRASRQGQAVTLRQYVDTAKVYSILYPDDWTLEYPVSGNDGMPSADIDWTKTSRLVLLKPTTGHKDNDVTIMADCNASSIAQEKQRSDKFHTQTAMRINDYDTLYDKLAFKGDAENYLHHTYVIEHGGKCVTFSYRENWHHPMSGTDFNDKRNIPAFEAIVRSVKFLEQ